MNGFPKLMGTGNPENGDYEAGLQRSSIIEQIIAIIDKGGPKEVKYDGVSDETFLSDKEIPKLILYYHYSIIEDECERFNSEYVAKAILKCLQQAPVDFKSVYDKQVWINTIEGMITK